MENKNQKELETQQSSEEQKAKNKRLLIKEEVMGLSAIVVLLALTFAVPFLPIAEWIRVVVLIIAVIAFFVICLFALKFEQKAGFYECEKCKHRYVPKYLKVLMAMHVGRTRYMRCPKCGKTSWQKKVLTDKDE